MQPTPNNYRRRSPPPKDPRAISSSIFATGPSNAAPRGQPSQKQRRSPGGGTPGNSHESGCRSYPSSHVIYSPVESEAFDSFSYHFRHIHHNRDSCLYRCSSLAFRIENTLTYLIFYGFFTLATLGLLLYDIGQRTDLVRDKLEPTWFVACDLVCITFLFFEILLRTMAHPDYWSSTCNQFDVLILILCIIFTYFYAFIPSEEIVSSATLLIRYILQFTRLVIFIRWYHSRELQLGFMHDSSIPLDRFDWFDGIAPPQSGKVWDHKSYFVEDPVKPEPQLSFVSRDQYAPPYTDVESAGESYV